jgi:hypothetical protein
VITRVFAAVTLVLVTLSFPVSSQAQSVLSQGLWINRTELMALPTSGTAWSNLLTAAQVSSCGHPNLSDQEDLVNVCVMAKALVFARTGNATMRLRVVDAIWDIVNSGVYNGRALALGRELAAYPIAADLIDLKNYDRALDTRFRAKLAELLITPTTDGPVNLIDCHERRPNNWGNHCGASRVAVAAYLGDTTQLARAAKVFKGYLGDRASYAGFVYGSDLSWQCNPSAPVGINPMGCQIGSSQVGGILPDDQRRAGSFTWPPPKENYVYEGLQGATVEAVILKRAGYDPFNWQNKALLRAFQWLQTQANFLATGDDNWLPFLVNYYYGKGTLPSSSPTRPGKNVGWTDWTHSGTLGGSTSGTSGTSTSSLAGNYTAAADTFVRGGTSGSTNFGSSTDLEVKDSTSTSNEYHRRIFLQFRVGKGSISKATLRVYVSNLPNGSPVPVCAFSVSSDAWTESGLTWNNQPAAGSSLACQSVTAPGWVTWDVTAFVKTETAGDGVVSLMLRDNTQSNRMARLDSRQSSNAPVMVVN